MLRVAGSCGGALFLFSTAYVRSSDRAVSGGGVLALPHIRHDRPCDHFARSRHPSLTLTPSQIPYPHSSTRSKCSPHCPRTQIEHSRARLDLVNTYFLCTVPRTLAKPNREGPAIQFTAPRSTSPRSRPPLIGAGPTISGHSLLFLNLKVHHSIFK